MTGHGRLEPLHTATCDSLQSGRKHSAEIAFSLEFSLRTAILKHLQLRDGRYKVRRNRFQRDHESHPSNSWSQGAARFRPCLFVQVETKALTRAVRRNVERFPADFVFQLAPCGPSFD
jgi:hypothetical protein